MSSRAGSITQGGINNSQAMVNNADQIIALDSRLGQLEQRTSNMRIFGIEDSLANRINIVGKFSAAGLVSLAIYCLCKRFFFIPRFPF